MIELKTLFNGSNWKLLTSRINQLLRSIGANRKVGRDNIIFLV